MSRELRFVPVRRDVLKRALGADVYAAWLWMIDRRTGVELRLSESMLAKVFRTHPRTMRRWLAKLSAAGLVRGTGTSVRLVYGRADLSSADFIRVPDAALPWLRRARQHGGPREGAGRYSKKVRGDNLIRKSIKETGSEGGQLDFEKACGGQLDSNSLTSFQALANQDDPPTYKRRNLKDLKPLRFADRFSCGAETGADPGRSFFGIGGEEFGVGSGPCRTASQTEPPTTSQPEPAEPIGLALPPRLPGELGQRRADGSLTIGGTPTAPPPSWVYQAVLRHPNFPPVLFDRRNPPPKIPCPQPLRPGADWTRQVTSAFRSTARVWWPKAACPLRVDMQAKQSKHRDLVKAGAKAMAADRIAPQLWFAWRFEWWARKGGKTPPPPAWALNPDTITRLARQYRKETEGLLAFSTRSPRVDELVEIRNKVSHARAELLRLRTYDVDEINNIVSKWFPNGWQDEYEWARDFVTKFNAEHLGKVLRGDYIWRKDAFDSKLALEERDEDDIMGGEDAWE